MYSIADFDLTNIIHRQDGSYVATVKSSGVLITLRRILMAIGTCSRHFWDMQVRTPNA